MQAKANQSPWQLVLVSIIGKYARLIQAYVSLHEQRLDVRYSQQYDFANGSQRQMDLFFAVNVEQSAGGVQAPARSC
jgi:hypothetical protein